MSKTFIPFLFVAILMISCSQEESSSDAYGNFEATTITVSSEANGKLIFLTVEEGDRVGEGRLVALVDTLQLHLQKKQIEATMNTLPKKLRTALADIEVLQNQKANLVRERDRIGRLVEKKAAPPKSLDDLNGELTVIDQQMEAIRSQTATANRGILAEKEPMLAQLDIIRQKIKDSYIHNPVDGTILTKLSEAHEMVGMGTPLYRLGQLDTMTLRFYVGSVQLQHAQLGQKISVLIDEGEDGYKSLEGTIVWISQQAEFTPKTIQTKEDRVNLVYAVKARVPNPEGRLKIGMPAEVQLNTQPSKTEEE